VTAARSSRSAAPPPGPFAGLTFALAGAGRVGGSLARWLAAGGARATAVAVRRPPRGGGGGSSPGAALAEELGARAVPFERLATGDDGLLLVAVSDPALDEVVRRLGERPQAAVALHTSGSRGASALGPLAAGGSAVGSFHPLRAFTRVEPDPAAARGVFFALDGDPAARALGRRLAGAWGAVTAVVPEGRRDLYHFAATRAAGGVTTLLAVAEQLADRLGLPPAVAAGYRELARGAVAATAERGAAAAITGPAARGDLATVERHLEALAGEAPDLAPLAALLALESRRQHARAGGAASPVEDDLADLEGAFRALAGRFGGRPIS
jgi:predicted short-subunit dehydrogenase-like oxidoreductase (DUF2520 family)